MNRFSACLLAAMLGGIAVPPASSAGVDGAFVDAILQQQGKDNASATLPQLPFDPCPDNRKGYCPNPIGYIDPGDVNMPDVVPTVPD